MSAKDGAGCDFFIYVKMVEKEAVSFGTRKGMCIAVELRWAVTKILFSQALST